MMKKALKKFVKPNDRVLDIGTGAYAIHSIWLKKNMNANVTATEISDEYSIRDGRRILLLKLACPNTPKK